MGGTIAPFPLHQWLTNAGAVAASHRLFTYLAGTSTKESTYTTVLLNVAQDNPITLNSSGRPASPIFLNPAKSYKFVLAPAGSDDPPASPVWTVDNISGVPSNVLNTDIPGTAGETIVSGQFCYLSEGDGGRTAGRWYKADADLTYASATAKVMGFSVGPVTLSAGDTGSFRIDGRATGLGPFTAGAPLYIDLTGGSLSESAPPTNPRIVAVADSTTSVVTSSWVSYPDASATVPGIVSITAQSFEGVKTFQDPPLFLAGSVASNTARVSGRIGAGTSYANVGNVGAGEDNLHSFSLPAATLGEDGQVLRITAWGTYFDDAGNKQVKLYFGAQQLVASGTLGDGADWYVTADVIRTGAATQRAVAHFRLTDAAGNEVHTVDVTTPTETLANAITVKCTGEATNNNDVIQAAMILEVIG